MTALSYFCLAGQKAQQAPGYGLSVCQVCWDRSVQCWDKSF